MIDPFLVSAWLLGLSVAAPIGPVNLEIIRRTLRDGWLSGAALGVGATLVDLSYFLGVTFGVFAILGHPIFTLVNLTAGGGVLIWLGVGALREGLRLMAGVAPPPATAAVRPGTPPSAAPPPILRAIGSSLAVGLVMTALNPMTIVFWATMPAGLFRGVHPSAAQILMGGLAVWAGTLTWIAALMVFLAATRHAVGPRLLGVVSVLGGAVIVAYGVRFWCMAVAG